jgi:Domain of unknown function (DUF1905)
MSVGWPTLKPTRNDPEQPSLARFRGTWQMRIIRRSSMPEINTHKFPIKAQLRKQIGKEAGELVTIVLKDRLE